MMYRNVFSLQLFYVMHKTQLDKLVVAKEKFCNDALLVERVKKLVLSTEFSNKVNTSQ